jgi:hypothetical protein
MTPELRSVLEDFEDKQFPPDVSSPVTIIDVSS